eukprot:3060609-Amphidinium_carterae.1
MQEHAFAFACVGACVRVQTASAAAYPQHEIGPECSQPLFEAVREMLCNAPMKPLELTSKK